MDGVVKIWLKKSTLDSLGEENINKSYEKLI